MGLPRQNGEALQVRVESQEVMLWNHTIQSLNSDSAASQLGSWYNPSEPHFPGV